MKINISTDQAPTASGSYSQAIRVGTTVYLSGQIPLVPATMKIVEGGIEEQITQVFENLSAVAKAAGGNLADIVKLNVFLIDIAHLPLINEIMGKYFAKPYPARSTIAVSALVKNVMVEIDAILELPRA